MMKIPVKHPAVYIAAGLAALSMSATAVHADDDHGRPVLNTVSQVLKYPIDDQKVRLEGRILRHVRGDTYIFADHTGEIRIDLDDDDDDAARALIRDRTRVILYGEVDKNRRSAPEIDVDDIHIR